MQKLAVRGGRPLYGTVDIHGAKNSILPVLAGCAVFGLVTAKIMEGKVQK